MFVDHLLSLAHTIAVSRGTQAVLLGSGVSRSAQVLTGWEITLDLIRRLVALYDSDPGPDLAAWYQAAYGEPPESSRLLGALAK